MLIRSVAFRRKDVPLYVTEGANHSLETGDVDADISELAKIMYICEEYMMLILDRDTLQLQSA